MSDDERLAYRVLCAAVEKMRAAQKAHERGPGRRIYFAPREMDVLLALEAEVDRLLAQVPEAPEEGEDVP